MTIQDRSLPSPGTSTPKIAQVLVYMGAVR
jgi:hypothetical protein